MIHEIILYINVYVSLQPISSSYPIVSAVDYDKNRSSTKVDDHFSR